MRRLLALAGVGLASTAIALAAVPKTITQTTLGGAPLGKPKAYYTAHFGTPVRLDRLEDDYERLVFTKLKVEVYFRSSAPAKGAAGILTWSKSFRTPEGVGSCSTVATLESAYGDKLRPVRVAGKIQAYRVGTLLFATKGAKRIGSVTLKSARIATFVSLRANDCA